MVANQLKKSFVKSHTLALLIDVVEKKLAAFFLLFIDQHLKKKSNLILGFIVVIEVVKRVVNDLANEIGFAYVNRWSILIYNLTSLKGLCFRKHLLQEAI
jgi:hypothetical protein